MGWKGQLTHRQFLCWSFWLHQQWNKPTRDNYYAMQISRDVQRSNAKYPNSIQTKDLKIKFEAEKVNVSQNERLKKQIEMTKAIVMGFMTAPITVKTGDHTEVIEPPLVKRKKLIEEQKEKQKEALNKARQAVKDKNKDKDNIRRKRM